MNSEKVKEIKEALEQNDDSGILYEVDYKKRTCKFIHHKDILTLINELESENKELRVVVDIANERTYRKKFTDEWRKEYQKELDKQGNGHIAGYPDFDLVYKLYFEQKDRIAELESENERLKTQLAQANAGNVNCSGCKLVEINAVRAFAEKLKEKLQNFIYDNEDYDGKLDSGILCVDLIGVIGMNGEIISLGLIDRLLKEYEK